MQVSAPGAARCSKLFEETATGGRWNRPGLHRMLDQLLEGGTVVLWKLDRLPPPLGNGPFITERPASASAGCRSVTGNVDIITAPERQRYGGELVTQALPDKLRAASALDFTPDGVRCRIILPASVFTNGMREEFS
jgi:hypothetical protein